jgi:hypothetical protein
VCGGGGYTTLYLIYIQCDSFKKDWGNEANVLDGETVDVFAEAGIEGTYTPTHTHLYTY